METLDLVLEAPPAVLADAPGHENSYTIGQFDELSCLQESATEFKDNVHRGATILDFSPLDADTTSNWPLSPLSPPAVSVTPFQDFALQSDNSASRSDVLLTGQPSIAFEKVTCMSPLIEDTTHLLPTQQNELEAFMSESALADIDSNNVQLDDNDIHVHPGLPDLLPVPTEDILRHAVPLSPGDEAHSRRLMWLMLLCFVLFSCKLLT